MAIAIASKSFNLEDVFVFSNSNISQLSECEREKSFFPVNLKSFQKIFSLSLFIVKLFGSEAKSLPSTCFVYKHKVDSMLQSYVVRALILILHIPPRFAYFLSYISCRKTLFERIKLAHYFLLFSISFFLETKKEHSDVTYIYDALHVKIVFHFSA